MASDELDLETRLPKSVVSFLEEVAEPDWQELRPRALTPHESAEATGALQGGAPAARALGLVVLNGTTDDNPFCWIGESPAKGWVVHFSHEPEPKICFSSLAALTETLHELEGWDYLDELLPFWEPHPDQPTLVAHLEQVLENRDEGHELVVRLLIQIIRPEQLDILDRAAASDDALVREAVAKYVRLHPLDEHLPLAQRLANDPHSQVARTGKETLARVHRLLFASASGRPPLEVVRREHDTHCPHCGVLHRWGLIRTVPGPDEIRHGCIVPNPGRRIRCDACRQYFYYEQDVDDFTLLAPAPAPKRWWNPWS
ncbi:MAG: hypothetical protein AAF533_18685 [Acidobacteriota bacterium]